MALKAAFIFVAPDCDPQQHRAVVPSPVVELHVVGVKNYREAAEAASALVAQGVGAIELCAGFGHEGVAAVQRAVGPNVPVGVVRFDLHPGFEHRSGDVLFQD
jgi:hypothetical protein